MLSHCEAISGNLFRSHGVDPMKENFLKLKANGNTIQYPASVIYEYIRNIFFLYEYNEEREKNLTEITNVRSMTYI
jgi:hypothetical protein